MARQRAAFTIAMVILCLPVTVDGQQTEVILLDNGASFEGSAVLETEAFLDLNIGQGRIRIAKAWIRTRTKLGGPGDDATSRSTLSSASPKPNEIGLRPERTRFPDWLKDGAAAVLPLRNLHRYRTRAASSEEAALSFCRSFQQGSAGDVVDALSNRVRVLESAFPNAARGLTSYSRRLAAKLLMRVVVAACGQPGIRAALGHARLTARRVHRDRTFERIEVSFHLGGGKRPVVVQLEVADGRLVGLANGPRPIQEALQQIRTELKAAGGKPYLLVPLLERAVEAEVTRSLPGGARDGSETVVRSQREVWHLRPKERRYVMTLPWTWEPAADDEAPDYADFLLRAAGDRCAATAVSEDGVLPLSELERAALEQLKRSHARISIEQRREIGIGGARALRLRVAADGGEHPLTYELLLIVIQNRACQFAAWCKTSEHEELVPTLESLFEGLRFLN